MAKPNYSQLTYEIFNLLPTLILFSCVFTVLISCLIGIVCCLRFNKKETAIDTYTKLVQFFTKLTMVIFGPNNSVFHYRPNVDEGDDLEIPVLYIHRKEVPTYLVMMMGSYVISFIMFSVGVFWDIFLLKDSSECDDTTIDCFAQVAGNDTSSPIYDCETYEKLGSNVTISCYSFVYSFGPALAASGGLFTMIKIVMGTIAGTFLALYGYALRKKKKRLLRFTFFLQLFLLLLIPFGFPIVLIVFVVGLPSLSYANIAQVVILIFTLAIGFSIPWINFVPENNEDHTPINRTQPQPQYRTFNNNNE